NHGDMDGFVNELIHHSPIPCGNADQRFQTRCQQYLGPKLQPDVMSYHTRGEIPNYWCYADHFVLDDRMFAPVDSWTLPSHTFMVSGWAAWCDDPSDAMTCTSDVLMERAQAIQ